MLYLFSYQQSFAFGLTLLVVSLKIQIKSRYLLTAFLRKIIISSSIQSLLPNLSNVTIKYWADRINYVVYFSYKRLNLDIL